MRRKSSETKRIFIRDSYMKILNRNKAANQCKSIHREAVMKLLAHKDEHGMVTVTVTYSPAYASMFDRIIHIFDGNQVTEQ
jgi:ABC-type lipoprotein export system ATPase subunit